jgi:hypothetical protein
MCPVSELEEITRKSGTIIYRFIRNNDIGTDIRSIKSDDILDVKFENIIYNNYKTGTCTSAKDSAGTTSPGEKDIVNKTIEDTCKELLQKGWKLFSSTKIE